MSGAFRVVSILSAAVPFFDNMIQTVQRRSTMESERVRRDLGTGVPASSSSLDAKWVHSQLTGIKNVMDDMKDNKFTDEEDYEILRRGMQAVYADYTVEHHMQEELRGIVKKVQDMTVVIQERMKFIQSLDKRLDFDAPIIKDNIGKHFVNRQCKLIKARKELYLRYQEITGRRYQDDFTDEGTARPREHETEHVKEQAREQEQAQVQVWKEEEGGSRRSAKNDTQQPSPSSSGPSSRPPAHEQYTAAVQVGGIQVGSVLRGHRRPDGQEVTQVGSFVRPAQPFHEAKGKADDHVPLPSAATQELTTRRKRRRKKTHGKSRRHRSSKERNHPTSSTHPGRRHRSARDRNESPAAPHRAEKVKEEEAPSDAEDSHQMKKRREDHAQMKKRREATEQTVEEDQDCSPRSAHSSGRQRFGMYRRDSNSSRGPRPPSPSSPAREKRAQVKTTSPRLHHVKRDRRARESSEGGSQRSARSARSTRSPPRRPSARAIRRTETSSPPLGPSAQRSRDGSDQEEEWSLLQMQVRSIVSQYGPGLEQTAKQSPAQQRSRTPGSDQQRSRAPGTDHDSPKISPNRLNRLETSPRPEASSRRRPSLSPGSGLLQSLRLVPAAVATAFPAHDGSSDSPPPMHREHGSLPRT